jgi:hypothetical protein
MVVVRYPPLSEIPDPKGHNDPNLFGRAVTLAHNRLSAILQETIWLFITLAVGAGTVVFLYLSSVGGPLMQQFPSLRSFYQLQVVFFGGFLFYMAVGYPVSVTLQEVRRTGGVSIRDLSRYDTTRDRTKQPIAVCSAADYYSQANHAKNAPSGGVVAPLQSSPAVR